MVTIKINFRPAGIRRIASGSDKNTLDRTADKCPRHMRQSTLFNFTEALIARLKQNGKIRTSETYAATLNSFKKFRSGEDIPFEHIDAGLMESYQAWLQNRGISLNTISFYCRILRAIYRRAAEEIGFEKNGNPFRHVYTGIAKTAKRALPLSSIKKIKTLELGRTPALNFARDMFMLSFYLRGMCFVDMAFLRKSDLRHGHITYRRRKTGQQLTIKWTNEMQQILDKYPENASGYLLPIIRAIGVNDRCAYRNAGYNINHNLKKIGAMIGANIPLTLYVARHSWASAAKAKGVPLGLISEGLGHDSEATTRIYLANLDTSAVDRANALILNAL